ncbi:MAG: formate dehydrogenase accessory sulfurtransferase FdhD [Chloroflexi bacterium]|nr:formate dehydrogenase accessory sulfurtransferase FdhD [Chloroflexota bacterium]
MQRYTVEGASSTVEEAVAREYPLTIILNSEELVTLLCSPNNLDYLAAGFLASEGFVKGRSEIKRIMVDEVRGVVRVETDSMQQIGPDVLFKRVITTGCGRGAAFYSVADSGGEKVETPMQVSAGEIFALVMKFQHGSELYLATHGVHSAALCDRQGILIFNEDIGRHNALDKIFGKCLMEDIPTDERLVITSGRVSSEMLHKVVKRRIPIVVSISAPTNLGVKIADNLGITLVGQVRGRKMNVYTHGWRVTG